jgi:hypothetical protein
VMTPMPGIWIRGGLSIKLGYWLCVRPYLQ